MKIGLIADVHGNRFALDAVLGVLRPTVERILFTGDVAGYYPFVAECVKAMVAGDVVGVEGNHDRVLRDCIRTGTLPPSDYERRYGSALRRSMAAVTADASTWTYLDTLPLSCHLEIDGRTIAMFHGAPWDPLEGRVYPDFDAWNRFDEVDADVVVLGQTHYALKRRLDRRLIVNPGSVGQPRDRRGEASYAVFDSKSLEVEHYRIPFDPTPLVADAVANDPDLSYLTEVLTRPL